jgi:cytochrome c-type biogenesis protein CcmH
MLLWITFALLAATVATLLLRAPRLGDVDPAHDPDLAVYRDQLNELDADVERGVVSAAEAQSARTEIARRLLKHAEPRGPSTTASAPANARAETVLLVGAIAIPMLSLAIYLTLGSPGLPGRPLADRLAAAPEKAPVNDLIAKVESRLREKPDDGAGWSVIAPVYLAQGRPVDAGRAFERAIALLGESPERLLGLGRSLVMANNGVVVEPAKAAYERVLRLASPAATEAKRAEATFWLAIYDEQAGRFDVAEATYRRMLAEAPADAPWRQALEGRLTAIAAAATAGNQAAPSSQAAPSPSASPRSAPPVTAQAAPPAAPALPPAGGPPGMAAPQLAPATGPRPANTGPTPAEFVAAAQGLSPEMREQMIGRMVARASDAVASNAQDLGAWSRLVTGYRALGKSDDAVSALRRAKAALAGDQAALAELDALAKSLGIAPS